ncbi:MAG: hypothetical protein K0Q73_9291, partial [Paenibacillus sp.]|nr:hypothetical protein [Paenibacillus sp.]
LCPNYLNELRRGDELFLAEKAGNQYRASYRASYEDWLQNDHPEAPFYIDIAEMEERHMFVEILQEGTEIKTVYVWTELTERLHPDRKAGETLGIYRATPAWEEKGYVKRVPITEVYAFRIHTPTDMQIQEGDRIILADSDGSTYFHEISKHEITGEYCVYFSNESWKSLERLCRRYRCYIQNMKYGVGAWPMHWPN